MLGRDDEAREAVSAKFLSISIDLDLLSRILTRTQAALVNFPPAFHARRSSTESSPLEHAHPGSPAWLRSSLMPFGLVRRRDAGASRARCDVCVQGSICLVGTLPQEGWPRISPVVAEFV